MTTSKTSTMRVLMTADTLGGVWTYALELANSLRDFGISIALATMGARLTKEQRTAIRNAINVTLFESDYKLEWMQDPWNDVRRSGEWLLKIEEQFKPDVIHLNGYAHGKLPWSAPLLVVGHSCVLSWWEHVKNEPPPEIWNKYKSEVAAGLARADLVIAPSQSMLTCLQKIYGPLPQARVIANARNPKLFKVAEKEEFVLGAGRLWDEAKNVAALQAAAPGLAWPVYVAGETKHPDGRRANTENIRSLGALTQSQMADWLARAAVCAFPARYEPFGLAVLEAGLSKCALVLGGIDSLRENWTSAAEFVHPDDTEELRFILTKLSSNDNYRKSLATAAYVRAGKFAPRKMALEYFNAYKNLVAEKLQRQSREKSNTCAS